MGGQDQGDGDERCNSESSSAASAPSCVSVYCERGTTSGGEVSQDRRRSSQLSIPQTFGTQSNLIGRFLAWTVLFL